VQIVLILMGWDEMRCDERWGVPKNGKANKLIWRELLLCRLCAPGRRPIGTSDVVGMKELMDGEIMSSIIISQSGSKSNPCSHARDRLYRGQGVSVCAVRQGWGNLPIICSTAFSNLAGVGLCRLPSDALYFLDI
jgi:hypothetical protein